MRRGIKVGNRMEDKIVRLESNVVTKPILKDKGQKILDAKISAAKRTGKVHFTMSGEAIVPNILNLNPDTLKILHR